MTNFPWHVIFGNFHAKFYMLYGTFVWFVICLLYSDFVCCVGKFCKICLRQLIFHAYNFSHASLVLRLHGISPMAMAIPPNSPVAMYGQHLATDGKSCEKVIQNSTNDHRWSTYGKTSGHRWKLTNFEVITRHVAHANAEKNGTKFTCILTGNFAITYSVKTYVIRKAKLHQWKIRKSNEKKSSWNEENTSGIKAF